MKKFFLYLLLFISIFVILLRFASHNINRVFNIKERAGLRIETTPKSIVTINGTEAGKTPFLDEDLLEGEYLITLRPESMDASSSAVWKGYVKLNPGTLTVVNRELADFSTSSSGEVITLEQGSGLTITSNPSSAEVLLDGKVVGRTPISLTTISVGEHRLIVSRENHLKRSINVTTVKDYNLTINVDLSLTEADLTQTPTIPITTTQEVTVLDTPTGFLRIRKEANINSEEISQVKPGDTLVLLEEQPNWSRVRTKENKEGWVSSTYIEKK